MRLKMSKVNIFKNKRISVKLTLIYAIILSLILIVISTITTWMVEHILWQKAEEEMKKTYDSVEVYIKNKNPIDNNLFKSIYIGDTYLRISNKDKVILENKRDNEFNKKENEELYNLEELPVVYMNKDIEVEGNVYSILLERYLEDEEEFLEVLDDNLYFMNIIGIIVAVISGFYLSKKILLPIKKITNTAKDISINDLSMRIEVGEVDDELNELARMLNDMIARLEESFVRQKQFTSDVSHELRTPISVIQGYVNLLDRWGKNDKEVLDESIQSIKTETESMKVLLEQLLFLSRADNDNYVLNNEKFWLNELIDNVVKETRLMHRNHNIEYIMNEKVLMYADKNSIKQVLRIIIDNSIKFTESGGFITIKSQKLINYVKINIVDTGIGIPNEDIPYIFDRFYRSDKSRTKSTGGTGLGLAIAKGIVDVNKGMIWAESEVGKGTTISIKVPIKGI
ncbi:sensor histidine kinase [Tepidibacter hydrothermalis]|uniref:histidine kinase n=1 Tax=Tepidibacter hydrothermalis TaxID=3036126 RepID=A0ABY8E9R3_9FIRM|nr:HAMP domain-containing sensor histidine kinase [Tepidibacter hydrothermalis]WFD09624.1 HAMP domain-containing sensor histidine kinase [Tepidibacter hydrothermalis]